MGVCFSIVRDDIGQRFELGKGHWYEIFRDEPAAMPLSHSELTAWMGVISPEASAEDAARRILSWCGEAKVRLITDDVEDRDWDRCLETGSIWRD